MKKYNIIFVFLLFIAIQTNAQDARKYTTYIVKSGETLKSIAKKVGCKYKEIKNLNPDVDKRHPNKNTTLVIPNKNYGKLVVQDIKPVKKEKFYIVQAGNTFYSIAKKYNVPIIAIKNANPITSDGLKPGMRLRIPSQEEITVKTSSKKLELYKIKKGDTKWNVSAKNNIKVAELERLNMGFKNGFNIDDNIWIPKREDTTIAEDEQTIDESLFIYHVVQKGEGLFRIAVIYNTTQEKIKEMNPEATKKLREGMLLKIPAKKKNNFLTHKVIKGDTFFSLSQQYGVSKSDLLLLNPDLKEGVKVDMLLNIREIREDDTLSNNKKLIDVFTYPKPLQVSFLMPLKLNQKVNFSDDTSKLQNICTDFYMGAEIALDSLRKQGLLVESHVYDTKNDLSVVYNLQQNDKLKESDIIIGPFFMGNAQRVANKFNTIPVYTPSTKQTFSTNENLIKTYIDQNEITNSLVSYLKEKYVQEKIIIITDTNMVNYKEADRIKKLLIEHDSISNITIFKPSRNKKHTDQIYMDKEILQKSIAKKKNTWVILLSDIKIISSDIVNTFGVLANKHSIKLFTTKVFKSFKHIDYQMLGKLSWSFPTNQFTELNDPSVSVFKKKYYRLNHAQPSKYSFTGFDMTYDSLIRLLHGESYNEGLEAGNSTRLSRKFDYIKTKNGYTNKGVLMVSFNKDLEYNILQ